MDIPVDIPLLLGEALERLGLTQDELSERIGVRQGTVSKWILATRRPGPDYWDAIARAIEVDKSVVASAFGETKLVRGDTLTDRLGVATDRIAELEAENLALQRRLRAEQ